MAGKLPGHILVHVATPLEYLEGGDDAEWIEGEPGEDGVVPTEGAPFPCVLFMPGPGGEEANPYKARVVRRPTLLYNPTRADSSAVALRAGQELLVFAPEMESLTGALRARWQLDGDPQPFGPPGRLYGFQATLLKVDQ